MATRQKAMLTAGVSLLTVRDEKGVDVATWRFHGSSITGDTDIGLWVKPISTAVFKMVALTKECADKIEALKDMLAMPDGTWTKAEAKFLSGELTRLTAPPPAAAPKAPGKAPVTKVSVAAPPKADAAKVAAKKQASLDEIKNAIAARKNKETAPA